MVKSFISQKIMFEKQSDSGPEASGAFRDRVVHGFSCQD